MESLNGLLAATFLILMAAAAAVTGSMVCSACSIACSAKRSARRRTGKARADHEQHD
jgi:hypothetical protein